MKRSIPQPGGARVLAALGITGLLLGLLSSCGNLVGGVEVTSLEPADAGTDAEPMFGAPGAPACEPGAARCQGPVVQTCAPDGSGWNPVQRCASAALCMARAGEQSRCLEPACPLGVSCDGSVLRECALDRTRYEALATCASAAHCDSRAGACQSAACVPGEVSCNGAVLQRCNDTRTGHDELAACATPALCIDWIVSQCDADRTSCGLVGAVCPVPTCEAGELRCAGTRLESCNAGRNGWDFVDECVTAGVCELTRQTPAAVACFEARCDPGDTICSETGAILACNIDQTDYTVPRSQCRSVDFCTPFGCEADPCTVGALSCNGSVLQVCQASADGSSLSRARVADCQTSELCQATLERGAVVPQTCVPPECAAGEFRCAGRQMQVCNAGRTGFVNRELCATDGLCQAGAGLGACPPPCSGFTCNGSVLRGCNLELTALVDQENCGTAAECDAVAGRCADPCVPGELRCNGVALEQCQNPLVGWQRLETCETAGLCAISVSENQSSCEPRRCLPTQHRCTGQRLEVCNADLTAFNLVETCGPAQICDAPNRQCDVCAANAVDCQGDVFLRCAANGQQETPQQCGAGLCSSSGNNVGCLLCPQANAFRCDNQGSLFQCSANQQQETQVDVCRTPQLCRAELGQCLACDPPGSSRCAGADVLVCSSQSTEVRSETCDSAELCRTNGASATCDESACLVPLQCTAGGEVLVCNAGQTGYRSQTPPVVCDTPALCDPNTAGGCRTAACQPGARRCAGLVVEICNDDQTGFEPEQTCGAGFSCQESGVAASCVCQPGGHRCVSGGNLEKCNGAGTGFAEVPNDQECNGAVRVSCSGTTVVSNTCGDDGLFCTGAESCNPPTGSCVSGGSPCGPGQVCSEATQCVECLGDGDCPAGGPCVGNVCAVAAPDGGT